MRPFRCVPVQTREVSRRDTRVEYWFQPHELVRRRDAREVKSPRVRHRLDLVRQLRTIYVHTPIEPRRRMDIQEERGNAPVRNRGVGAYT